MHALTFLGVGAAMLVAIVLPDTRALWRDFKRRAGIIRTDLRYDPTVRVLLLALGGLWLVIGALFLFFWWLSR
jgi:hypothetical protein